jgi:hypothetical protein
VVYLCGDPCPFQGVEGVSDSGEETGRVGGGGERGDAPETAGTDGLERIRGRGG